MEENQQQVVPPQQAPPVVEPNVSPADVLTPQETSTKGNKAIWFLGLLTALVLLVVAYLAYQNNQLKKELKVVKLSNTTAKTQVSISPTEAITPTPDPTVGWETYSNEEYGFIFKYPTNQYELEVSEITNYGLKVYLILHPAEQAARGITVVKDTTVLEIINNIKSGPGGNNPILEESVITIGGIEGKLLVVEGVKGPTETEVVLVEKEGKVYRFDWLDRNILSTFEFTDSADIQCQSDQDCFADHFCDTDIVCPKGTSECSKTGTNLCVSECVTDSDCQSPLVCKKHYYFSGSDVAGTTKLGCTDPLTE